MSLAIDGPSSPAKFNSPINSKDPREPKQFHRPKRQLLFDDSKPVKQPHLDISSIPPTLSELYGSFFDSPLKEGDHLYAEVEEHYQGIETQLRELSNPEFTDLALKVRSYLRFLLSAQKEHPLLLAEIGILRFYLDSKLNYLIEFSFNEVETDQLLRHRSQEIKRELGLLEADYQKFVEDPKASFAPSGKKYYLLRALVHMVVLSTGDYNKGGLVALGVLVENPHYQLAQEFDVDHAFQIQNVVAQIQKHSGFDSLLKKTIMIHPSLEDLIRCDLMLKSDEKVKSPHIHLALILSLLRPNFQTDLSNCYSVASWNFLVACYPFHIYSKMIDWITAGHVSLPQMDFPIEHLLDNRLQLCSEQLDAKIKVVNSQESSTLAFLRSRFAASLPLSLPDQTHVASTLLSNLTTLRGAKQSFSAHKLHLTFFESLLANTGLSIIEFVCDNRCQKTEKYYYKELKNKLISICLNELLSGKELDRGFQKIYQDKLSSKLHNIIWLDAVCRPRLEYEHNLFPVKVNGHKIPSFSGGDFSSLIQLLEQHVGVFSLIGDIYQKINSLEEFKRLLIDRIIEIESEIEDVKTNAEVFALDKVMQHALKQVEGNELTHKLSKFIAKKIKLTGVTPEAIKDAGLFFFYQLGGNEAAVIKDIFDLNPQLKSYPSVDSAGAFLETIFNLIEEMGESNLQKTPKLILSVRSDHAWTVTPHLWLALADKVKDREAFWKSYRDDPVQKKLQALKPGTQTSWGDWRTKMLKTKTTSPKKAAENRTNVDEMMSRVKLTPSDLKKMLSQFNLPFSELKIMEIANSFESQYPYQIAKLLRGVCLAEKMRSPCTYALEIAICEQMGLPIEIYLGDMNWGDNKENSSHTDLVVRWNWAKGAYELAARDEHKITPMSDLLNKEFYVYLPAVV